MGSQFDYSYEHPKQILKLTDKKIFTILCSNILYISRPMYNYFQDFGIDKNLSERIADIENDPALRGSLEKVG